MTRYQIALGWDGRFQAHQYEGTPLQNGGRGLAFAFDPSRRAILLVAGDKAGITQKRFYTALVRKADKRFSDHLKRMKED